MNPRSIKKGDIITYWSGKVNYVNKPDKYHQYFNNDFKNQGLGINFTIMKIQRYVKFLGFYKLKTIYEREGTPYDKR